MNAALETSTSVRSQMLPAPQLRRARFEDYEGIARLALALSKRIEPPYDWRSFWLDNPLWRRLGKSWPIGWVLEAPTGEIVGSFMNIPSLYTFRGQALISANGRAWAVTPAYRGYALWLIDEYFNQTGADLFINTTVGPAAAPTLEQLSTRIPLGDWQTASCWITGYVGFAQSRLHKLHVPLAELLAHPVGGALWLKDAICNRPLGKLARGFFIETADHFDSRFDAFGDELVRQTSEKLLAERNSRTLSWHFAIPMRTRRLWVFTASRSRQLRAWCALICKENGRQVVLVDYQTVEPKVDLLRSLLQAALRRCASEGMHTLSNPGRGVPKMRALDDRAPYRIRQENWSFYYRATDPNLDTQLRASQFWDPSAYDGDASLA